MSRHPLFGLALALFGTLMLTPDALLMRWSEMSGFQMAAWRGMMMGTVMVLSRQHCISLMMSELMPLRSPP